MLLGEFFYLDVKYIRCQVYDFYYEKVYEDSDFVFRYNWVLKCFNCIFEEVNVFFILCGYFVYCSDCVKVELVCFVCNIVVISW